MQSLIVLSHVQAKPLLKMWQKQQTSAEASPDLGQSILQVNLSSDGVLFPGEKLVNWKTIEQIAVSENKCFVIRDQEVREIKQYSDCTD